MEFSLRWNAGRCLDDDRSTFQFEKLTSFLKKLSLSLKLSTTLE
jgi:hypothetical protein